jgi:hypothetical protein
MPSNKKRKRTQKKSSHRTAKPNKKKSGVSIKKNASKRKAKRKTVQKRALSKSSPRRKAKGSISTEQEIQREIQNRRRTAIAGISGRQTGDLEGLSRTEQADSESVDELAEEGNLFEAGAVAGVEEADNEDEREVHTHEVPEDDVPEEYLDKD